MQDPNENSSIQNLITFTKGVSGKVLEIPTNSTDSIYQMFMVNFIQPLFLDQLMIFYTDDSSTFNEIEVKSFARPLKWDDYDVSEGDDCTSGYGSTSD